MNRLNWLVSYPKSGNTWMRVLLATYFHGQEDAPVLTGDKWRYFYDQLSPKPGQILLRDLVLMRPTAIYHIAAFYPDSDLIIKSHHACCEISGMPLFAGAFCDRVVVIVRDPRDVLPSLCAHMGFDFEQGCDFMASSTAEIGREPFIQHFLGSWSNHVGSWIRTQRVPRHIVRYEDMHEDTCAALRGVLEFLGIEEPDESRIETAVGAAKFDRLQRVENEGGFDEASEKAERFFRKGKVGGWRDEVPDEYIARIEEDHAAIMERMDYEPVLTKQAA